MSEFIYEEGTAHLAFPWTLHIGRNSSLDS